MAKCDFCDATDEESDLLACVECRRLACDECIEWCCDEDDEDCGDWFCAECCE